MGYLLPAGMPSRSKTKWGGLGAIANGAGAAVMPRSNLIFFRPPVTGPQLPGPPSSVGPIVTGPYTYTPPGTAAPTPTPPSTGGTPVPAGYPPNQFFVAPDGSVWEYSTSSNSWFNTGTPYNTGAASSAPPAANAGVSAPPQPVSVTVAPAAAESGYQSILDWLTQETLITSVPNWIVASGVGLLIWKATNSGGKR